MCVGFVEGVVLCKNVLVTIKEAFWAGVALTT